MKIDWFDSEKYLLTEETVNINWFKSEQHFFTDDSVKRQITDSISENLTDSDLESILLIKSTKKSSCKNKYLTSCNYDWSFFCMND